MSRAALSVGQLLNLCTKWDHWGLATNSLQISSSSDREAKRVSLSSCNCVSSRRSGRMSWCVVAGQRKPLLWLPLGLEGCLDFYNFRHFIGLPWRLRKEELYRKEIESTGLPNVEKVNLHNSPSSDEHGGGTWREKRWRYCYKSLFTFWRLLSPTLPLSWVTDVMPSLNSGQMFHAIHAHVPSTQHSAFLSHWPGGFPVNYSLSDLSCHCKAKHKQIHKRKQQKWWWWNTRSRNHFRLPAWTPVTKPVTTLASVERNMQF